MSEEGLRIALWFLGTGTATTALGVWLAWRFDDWALWLVLFVCAPGVFVALLGLIGLRETWLI